MIASLSEPADLLALDRRALEDLLRSGYPLDPGSLEGWVFRGTSLGLPGWVDRLAWKTFAKVFHRDAPGEALRGWNVRLEQGLPPDELAYLRDRDGSPLTFGHFKVVSGSGHAMPIPAQQGLLLHYGLGRNRALDPVGWLRDPLVALREGDADLLLGWSYLERGPLRASTPSFFVLERHAKLDHVAKPPRG